MLTYQHNITVRKRRASKQRLQIQQCTAADRGHRRQAHTTAGHQIEHPLRDLQEPSSWVLIGAALEHSSLIPGESFVDRHSASVPRVPWVKDFSRFNIMGVALSSCIMRTGHISDWARELHTAGFLPQRWDAWLLASDLADCIIVTTALPKARSPDEKPVNKARGLV